MNRICFRTIVIATSFILSALSQTGNAAIQASALENKSQLDNQAWVEDQKIAKRINKAIFYIYLNNIKVDEETLDVSWLQTPVHRIHLHRVKIHENLIVASVKNPDQDKSLHLLLFKEKVSAVNFSGKFKWNNINIQATNDDRPFYQRSKEKEDKVVVEIKVKK
jgi:hypothetical protein